MHVRDVHVGPQLQHPRHEAGVEDWSHYRHVEYRLGSIGGGQVAVPPILKTIDQQMSCLTGDLTWTQTSNFSIDTNCVHQFGFLKTGRSIRGPTVAAAGETKDLNKFEIKNI